MYLSWQRNFHCNRFHEWCNFEN